MSLLLLMLRLLRLLLRRLSLLLLPLILAPSANISGTGSVRLSVPTLSFLGVPTSSFRVGGPAPVLPSRGHRFATGIGAGASIDLMAGIGAGAGVALAPRIIICVPRGLGVIRILPPTTIGSVRPLAT